ncbi:lactosylceramide 4-alpha-galactosyltransferase-like [Convolutriloba macropyga]|uniref:lactosylceramide 4-alpha-galactosyltransferase-like n=1 Tax=Convolutriloba macropyga TaxID=536237 RepID=UPI003F51C718
MTEMFMDTPIEGIDSEMRRVKNEHNRAVMLSDLLRMAIVYKYGGFYSDLDAVIIRSLKRLSNVVGTEDTKTKRRMSMGCRPPNGSIVVENLINGNFHLEKGHPLAYEIMKEMKRIFDPKGRVNHIGPLLTTRIATSLYNLPLPLTNINGPQLSILPFYSFAPVGWKLATAEYFYANRRKSHEWESLFNCSYIVHTYGHFNSRRPIRGDPIREAYAYLGNKHCLKSLQRLDQF